MGEYGQISQNSFSRSDLSKRITSHEINLMHSLFSLKKELDSSSNSSVFKPCYDSFTRNNSLSFEFLSCNQKLPIISNYVFHLEKNQLKSTINNENLKKYSYNEQTLNAASDDFYDREILDL